MNIKSQIETSEAVKSFVDEFRSQEISPAVLVRIKDKMMKNIVVRDYNDQTKEHEKLIRWKRTASEILNDAYVYKGKACTDFVVLFIALCKELGLETWFVKITKEKMVHSVAEIKLPEGWFIFDVSNSSNTPIPGQITETNPYKDWKLWKKGRDAWDINLIDFDSIKKIER